MQLPIYYSTTVQPSFNQRELLGHLAKKKKSQNLSPYLQASNSCCECLNFEIPNTACRSHQLFLVHRKGHVSITNIAVLGYCLTALLCLNLVSTELKSVEC